MKRIIFIIIAASLLTACSDNEVNKKEDVSTKADKSEKVTVAKEEKKDDVPREHKNALKSAQNYLNIMAFSEKGLYQQLTSEAGDKYPDDAAQYAIDNVKVDYNEQALKAAKNYQSIMPMSDQELLNQLTSDAGDKYTQEQAQYAIDNLDK